MKIAIVAAGFTPAEADELRRSMALSKRRNGKKVHDKLINGMLGKGYKQDYAERVFKQLEGFGSYGFPESHAAAFALLVYVSSWIKCYYPDVFACGLLNSQPMGFYAPAQIVSDAKNHGVSIRPIDVNYSSWDNTLEEKLRPLLRFTSWFSTNKRHAGRRYGITHCSKKRAIHDDQQLIGCRCFHRCFGKISRCRCLPVVRF
jgi:DNA polymerase III alpha subunit